MGKFIYEQFIKVEIEDRTLAHIQLVVCNKLRRGEPLLFSWRDDASTGDGRTSVWINSQSSLVFKFYGSRRPALNRMWVEALAYTANAPTGLHAVPEPVGSFVDAATDHARAVII